MRLWVQVEEDKEAVEDWSAFRERFEAAAADLDLTITEITHIKERT